MARHLDGAVVLLQPGLDLLAEVPGGVVPDQGEDPHALGRELLAAQARKAQVTGLTGRPSTKRSSMRARSGSQSP